MSINPVRDAWFEAALDLRIRIQEPNPLKGVPDNPARVVYLPDFGNKNGAVLFVQDFHAPDLWDTFDLKSLDGAGYYSSVLSFEVYSQYSRPKFIETLVDLGYFGPPEKCPEWYVSEVKRLSAK